MKTNAQPLLEASGGDSTVNRNVPANACEEVNLESTSGNFPDRGCGDVTIGGCASGFDGARTGGGLRLTR